MELAILGIDSTREVAQALVTGIVAGSGYAMLGVALALIFGVTGRFHFALGSSYMLSSFLAAVAVSSWGLPLVPAVLVGLAAGVLLGVLIEALVYQPLDRRSEGDALLTIFVASLGVVIVVENLVRLIWGSNTRNLSGFPDASYNVAEILFSRAQILQVVVAIVLIVGLALLLKHTVLGQQMRAARGNQVMSVAVGINVKRIFLIVFAIGTLIACVAAMLAGIRFAVNPSAGTTPVFYAFVVVFVAGATRSPIVVGLVGLLIGVLEQVSTIWVSQNLSTVTVFGLLFIFIAVRSVPEGVRQLTGSITTHSRVTRGGARRAGPDPTNGTKG